MAEDFDQFWAAYPKRKGANPKHPARLRFHGVVNVGTKPAEIIDGAKRYSVEQAGLKQIGTPFVAQAVTWLNQRRWEDYPAPVGPKAQPYIWVLRDDPRWQALSESYRRVSNGKNPPTTAGLGGHGWHFPTALMVTGSAGNANPAHLTNERGAHATTKGSFLGRNETECKLVGEPGHQFQEQSPESVTHSTGGPNGEATALFVKADR